ncbi:MAG: serine hydrolase domain-containing protein [Candidatus Nanopelagicales bacterium]
MDAGAAHVRSNVEQGLWPLVEALLGTHEIAGLAVAVVRDGVVVERGFGVRDLRSGDPVTPTTMLHLASVSKPFVATAVMSLAAPADGSAALVDLDAPVTRWVPELRLADGREDEVTVCSLLSHTSGLPDVSDYGWHDPQLGDDALAELAASLGEWRLQSDPGARFAYSNTGYELLGLMVARAAGTTFEDAARRLVLDPVGMTTSTFLRADVPTASASAPHVGMPLRVPDDAYPYTRRHAPSSTLHSSAGEMARWILAHVGPAYADGRPPVDRAALLAMREPVAEVGEPPWESEVGLGWFLGEQAGLRTISHTGADPGFGSRVVMVPEARAGVVVLACSNTVPTGAIATAALDLALCDPPYAEVHDGALPGVAALRDLRPPVAGPVARVLAESGPDAAVSAYERLASAAPPEVDLDDDGFENAVWGAIELHRTDLVRPLLDLWLHLSPDSSTPWTMSGWAHLVDGETATGRAELARALELDPENDDATLILRGAG